MSFPADTRRPASDQAPLSVTIGITTFNGLALLRQTLPSVAAEAEVPGVRVVVVDDGSDDGTTEWLAAHYPDVAVVSHDGNLGVAAAMNSCLRAAVESEFVILLNNDVELAPRCVERLCRCLRDNPGAAAVSPKMLRFSDRGVIDGSGDIYTWIGFAKRRGQGERDVGQFDEPERVFGVCGGAAAYRRSALRAIGDFDSRFFAYYEDVDWAVRANRLGYQCRYEPAAVVFHMDGATTGGEFGSFAAYHSWRNVVWVMAKNWSTRDVARFGWLFLIGQILTLILALERGMLGVLFRAWRDASIGLPGILRERRSFREPTVPLSLPWSPYDLSRFWTRSYQRHRH